MTRTMLRQGDVLLLPTEQPSADTLVRAVDETGQPLAGLLVAGERTGHAHRLPARVYSAGSRRLLMLERPTPLRHVKDDGVTQADHQPVEVPAGWWEVRIQREHVPQQAAVQRWD